MTLTKTKRQTIRREIRKGKAARAEAAKFSNRQIADKVGVGLSTVSNVLYRDRPSSNEDHELIRVMAHAREKDLEKAEYYSCRKIAKRHGLSLDQVRVMSMKESQYDRKKTDNDAGADSEPA